MGTFHDTLQRHLQITELQEYTGYKRTLLGYRCEPPAGIIGAHPQKADIIDILLAALAGSPLKFFSDTNLKKAFVQNFLDRLAAENIFSQVQPGNFFTGRKCSAQFLECRNIGGDDVHTTIYAWRGQGIRSARIVHHFHSDDTGIS